MANHMKEEAMPKEYIVLTDGEDVVGVVWVPTNERAAEVFLQSHKKNHKLEVDETLDSANEEANDARRLHPQLGY